MRVGGQARVGGKGRQPALLGDRVCNLWCWLMGWEPVVLADGWGNLRDQNE